MEQTCLVQHSESLLYPRRSQYVDIIVFMQMQSLLQ